MRKKCACYHGLSPLLELVMIRRENYKIDAASLFLILQFQALSFIFAKRVQAFFQQTMTLCFRVWYLLSSGDVGYMRNHVVPNPSTWHFGDHIERHKVTNLRVVPPIVLAMAKQRVADRYHLSLRRIGFGGCSIWERVDMA